MLDVTTRGRPARIGILIVAAAAATISGRAQAVGPSLYSGLSWRCIGPFDGGPVAAVAGVSGEAGIYTITTPSGGAWKTIDGGETWMSVDRGSAAAVTSDLPRWTEQIVALRNQLVDGLRTHGFEPEPSDANWVLVKAPGLRDHLARRGIAVRDCTSFGLPEHVRIAVPDLTGMTRLMEALPT